VHHRPLSLAAGSVLDAAPAAVVDAAAAAGFDGVGLRLSHDHAIDAAGRRRLAALLAERGLRLFDAEVHRIDASAGDPGPLVDAAAELGAAHVLVVSDLPDERQTLEALGRVAERCRAGGLTAALEYMAWTTPDSSAGAVRMADAVDAVVVVDLLHHHRLGEGPEALRAVVRSGRLGWVQLCDAPAAAPPGGIAALLDEARHHRLAPGTGGLPLTELLAAVPPGTPLSVEVQSDELAAACTPTERAGLVHRAATALLAAAHAPNSTG
jgi:sugar phosphate isomerase/epimerase